MGESITVTSLVPVAPEKAYAAWMNGEEHSAFTGSAAEIDPRAGGKFTAWDGYIWGKTLELEPGRRIVQSWRTSDFSEHDRDSRIEVTFNAVSGGTEITLVHTDIPEGQGDQYPVGRAAVMDGEEPADHWDEEQRGR